MSWKRLPPTQSFVINNRRYSHYKVVRKNSDNTTVIQFRDGMVITARLT